MSIKFYDSLSISTGQLVGYSHVNKIGRHTTVGTGTFELIWSLGGSYLPPTIPQFHEVSSNSEEDIGALVSNGNVTSFNVLTNNNIEITDTGATYVSDGVLTGDTIIDNTRIDHSIIVSVDSQTQITIQPFHDTNQSVQAQVSKAIFTNNDYTIITTTSNGTGLIQLFGLDENLNEVIEFVLVSGSTPIQTTNQYLRINKAHSIISGIANTNVGDISINGISDLTTTAFIAAADGKTMQSFFTVPNGKTAFMTNFTLGVHRLSGPDANVMVAAELKANTHIPQSNSETVEDTIACVMRGDSFTTKEYNPYKVFKARTDIWMDIVFASSNNLNVSGSFDIILIDDEL